MKSTNCFDTRASFLFLQIQRDQRLELSNLECNGTQITSATEQVWMLLLKIRNLEFFVILWQRLFLKENGHNGWSQSTICKNNSNYWNYDHHASIWKNSRFQLSKAQKEVYTWKLAWKLVLECRIFLLVYLYDNFE